MKDKISFQLTLLNWFFKNQRTLPWRKTYTPYEVWISEIMMQQTQVERAVDHYKIWMQRFPNIDAITGSSENEILQYWEGLGYYSRAKNIYKCAQKLTREHNSRIPKNHQVLLKLPGIGPYTAGAIMSIGFNEEYPAVDANVMRVFSRLFNINSPIGDSRSRTVIQSKARHLIPMGNARYFNQAIMELGALICTPSRPQCKQCPVNSECVCFKLGITDERPVPGKSCDIINIEMSCGILIKNGLLFIQKRPEHGVWANLWEFPGGRLEKGEQSEQGLIREFKEETEMDILIGNKITTIKHSFTRYRITLHCFFCTLATPISEPTLHEASEYRWITPDKLSNFPFPSPHRKLINIIRSSELITETPLHKSVKKSY